MSNMYLSSERINAEISLSKEGGMDTNKISDGYHTFGELYEHRCVLWIAFCKRVEYIGAGEVWRSKKDGEGNEIDGWFLLGINSKPGEQMTYHLPIRMWNDCNFAAILRFKAPEFDGHTAADVLERIKKIDQ